MPTPLQLKNWAINWHPYTQHQTASLPIVICKGKDALLWDEDGKTYIDAIASWWANPHGHCRAEIAQAISEQVLQLEHVLFGGFTHPKAIELSELLLAQLPHQHKVFYSDNGSTAVEVALKMALQYFLNQGIKKKNIIAFEGAFHGDTFGAMAASGIGLFTDQFADFFMQVEQIPVPNAQNIDQVVAQLKGILAKNESAAFIFEPLVQGANAMHIYQAEHLDALIALCQDAGVLCIADEVMTGFGRTGRLFASDYLQQKPDIYCFSKALSGGFVPLAATTASQKIFDAFYSPDTQKAFFHGHTFMANPAACAAAVASLKISLSPETKENISRISDFYQAQMPRLATYKNIKNIRQLGVIFAFDLVVAPQDYYSDLRNQLYHYFINQGIIIRPVGNCIYILPAYVMSNAQLETIFKAFYQLLNPSQNTAFEFSE
jgi:adenosylmethionine---8-amino-7-oxononanoate aminotransferase